MALRTDPLSHEAEFAIAGGALDYPRLYLLRDPSLCSKQDAIPIQLDDFGGLYGYILDVAISGDGRYSLFGAANSKRQ
jgi:hypothetical protein